MKLTLEMTPYEAQRFSVAIGEYAADLHWQGELFESLAKQLNTQIDTATEQHDHPGFPPAHPGYLWIGLGLPRKGQWYDDGFTFEQADKSWVDKAHQVNIYEPVNVAEAG